MHTIFGTHKDSVGQHIAAHFSKNADCEIPPHYAALGWIKGDKLVGQAVFENYTGSNIEIHIYGKKCLTRQSLKDVYNYVFLHCKCNRLTAKPYITNEYLSRLLLRLGFVYEGVLKNYYGTPDAPIDALVYRLDRSVAIDWLNNA